MITYGVVHVVALGTKALAWSMWILLLILCSLDAKPVLLCFIVLRVAPKCVVRSVIIMFVIGAMTSFRHRIIFADLRSTMLFHWIVL